VKIPLEKVLCTIEQADLDACSDAIHYINQLDFYQYNQEELKLISDTISGRINTLLRLEIRKNSPSIYNLGKRAAL